MHKTIEAILEADGTIRPLERVETERARRALVTILHERGEVGDPEAALLSERALGDWERAEEDEAWNHLQPER